MAVTRINNNQITTASAGNAYLGINAAAKLQNYSITSNKIANSLVYGSDLTVSGNLTVNGTTTTVDTVNTLIKDPILVLADGQTAGTPTVDIGILGYRGNQNSSFLGWQESGATFMAILSNTTVSNTTVNVTSYANFTASTITAQGNLSVVGNIVGNANFSGNVSAGNLLTSGLVSATGNLRGGNINTAGIMSATGNIYGGNSIIAGSESVTGNITGGNLLTAGLISATSTITSAANITGGNLLTSGLVSATGNATAGNITTAGLVSATANVTGGNILTAGLVSATGNAIAGNILTAGLISATSTITSAANISGGNLLTGGVVSATANVTGGNITTAGLISATGNATAGNVLTSGLISATGNITGGNINGTLYGNVNATTVSATANITGGNILTGGLISATGNATAGNIVTAGLVTATGNISGGNVIAVALVQGANVSATANVTGGNILTAGLISAGGNITTATNINTPNVVATGNLTLTGGNVLLTPTGSGNVVLPAAGTTYINNLAQPVQNNDAASKIYVDNMVSTQLAYHQAVYVATTANLATTTGGTITYNNGANGIGANITTTGSFNLIDTANVQTANTRILVKNEGNAALNGVYVWSNATVITRSTDADSYGPNSTTDLSINDYFFVQNGNVNKGAAYIVDGPSGVITFGTSNITFAQFSSSQTYSGGNGISLYGTVISTVYDNSTIGVNGSNQLYIPANAPLTTPNIGAATGTSLSVTGTVTATTLSSTGNTIAGNVTTAGLVSSTGNITGGNILTAGLVSSTGNATAGNILTAGVVSATANITGGNILTAGLISATSTITSVANITGGNILTAGIMSSTGNAIAGNILTAGVVSATANVTGGNITTAGLITATGNVTGGNILTAGLISATSTITSAANITGGNLLTGGVVSATANVTGGNITTVGLITATGNVTAGNLLTAGIVSATGNATAGNVLTGGLVSATANITGGNILTAGIMSSTGNAIHGNILTSGLISATANITGGNLLTAGLISSTGTGTFGNIQIGPDSINDIGTNQTIRINSTGANTNFAVQGSTVGNVFYVNASTGTASFGNSTQTTNAVVAFNATNSILLPTGTLGQRPATGVTGMVRFNTTNNQLEIYDNSTWTPVGATVFTVIADQQFNGDGSTVAFTLSSTQTTNSCIVSINGIVQVPGVAYSVAGTNPTCVLTFTEAPAVADLIDVRQITTTTTVTAISNNSGNAQITGDPFSATMTVLGNLNPTANVTYTLGNATSQWSAIYVANVNIGGNVIGNISTNSITNSGANGTGNIGNATNSFNTIFAKATSAQYADLAEKYVADAAYAPGTVVSFGGDKEVTKSAVDADRTVAGVISTNPSYIMNGGLEAEHVAVVAFTGRVPTSVTGTVAKGDLMVSNGDGTARAEAEPKAGAIIGKALENFDGATGVIEVVIGRF